MTRAMPAGVIVEERDGDEDAEKAFAPVGRFNSLTYWNHDVLSPPLC